MNFSHYPEQEPFNENMVAYHDYLIDRAKGLKPIEVSYGNDPYQSMAIFPAENADGRVVLFFHGGGWTNGYKEWMYFIAPALTARGITFVSAGYRLAPQHVFPEGFADCQAALQWLAKNISNYGGDPEKIFVSGHSAGGHYAALLAVKPPEGIPAIKGCAPVSGIYYFGDGAGMAVRPRFLGPPEANAEEAASPINFVRKGLPRFLLSYGSDDFPHLVRQAGEMQQALEAESVSVQTLKLPNCNHFTASYAVGDIDRLWAQTFDAWSKSA